MDKFTISKNVQVSPDGYFSKALSSDFDRHVKKSIPFYNDFILKMSNLSNFFVHNRSCVHDLGCSTGTLLQMMQKVNKNKKDVKYIGIDNSNEMVKVARKNTKGIKNIKIINSDILQYDFETSDLIISSLTTHFIQPHLRLPLLDKIYKSLNPKGAFIMLEKVNFANATTLWLVPMISSNAANLVSASARSMSPRMALSAFCMSSSADVFMCLFSSHGHTLS